MKYYKKYRRVPGMPLNGGHDYLKTINPIDQH